MIKTQGKKGSSTVKKVFVAIAFASAMVYAAVAKPPASGEGFPGFGGGAGFFSSRFGDGPKSYVGQPKVVLKECCVYPPLGTNVPSSAVIDRFKAGSKGAFKSTYLVLAKDIVDIDIESLAVDSIADSTGKEYARRPNGEPNWESDIFRSSVNREAGFGTFMIYGWGNAWANSLPKVKGRVKITVADKMETKKISGKVSSGMVGTGDLSYKVKIGKGFMSDGKTLEVSPAGAKSDCEIEVSCGGKKLDYQGSMTMMGNKTCSFKAPETDDIVISATFPVGSKTIELPFGQAPAQKAASRSR